MESFYTEYYFLYGLFTLVIVLDILGSIFSRKLAYLHFQSFMIFLFLLGYYFVASRRGLDVGADTYRYYRFYQDMYNSVNVIGSDIGFFIYNKFLVFMGIHPQNYLYFLSLLFVIPIFFAFKQFKNVNYVFLLWFFASLFIFLTMSINILRQGIGGAFAIWGLSMLLHRNNTSKLYLIPFIIAPFFHLSLFLFVLVLIFTYYVRNLKLAYFVLIASIVLSYLKLNVGFLFENVPLLGHLLSERMEGYLGVEETYYKVGFRFDFLLFNLFFMGIAYYMYNYVIDIKKYPFYKRIFLVYIYLTAYFVLMFNVPYSDRFGILSWMLIPFLIYPIFDLNTDNYTFKKLGIFAFGLLMFLIFNVR